jgi:glycine cleavage system H protein
MKTQQGYYYTEQHEWIRLEDKQAYIGITDYAQDSMGDIVYVELPPIDDIIDAGEQCAVIESVKAAADIYMPVTGKIVAINEEIEEEPGMINKNPFDAYLFAIIDFDQEEVKDLMDADAYEKYCSSL